MTVETSYAQWVARTLGEVRQAPQGIISLFESSVGEPVDLVRKAVLATFGEPVSPRYASAFSDGNPYVIARIAESCGVAERQVLSTTGATAGLALVVRALVRPGQRVLIENPAFDLFANIARRSGFAVDRFERRGERFVVDPDVLEARIGASTGLVILSNLHNPSGMMIDRDTMVAIGRIADRHGVLVVFDEVYADFDERLAAPAAAQGISDRFISINSLTKRYALSTLRCGWIVADEQVMTPLRAWSRDIEFSISKLAHAVAASVLERPEPFRERTDAILRASRPVMERWHTRWRDAGMVSGILPERGCIAFPRLEGIGNTRAFSHWLARESGVVVAPGEYFGAAGHVRIGFGIEPDRLEHGLACLGEAMIAFRDSGAAVKSAEG